MKSPLAKTIRVILPGLAVCGLLLWMSGSGLAVPPFMHGVRAAFKLKGNLANCHLCHTYDETKRQKPDEDNLNAFGLDMKKSAPFDELKGMSENHQLSPKETKALEDVIKAIWNKDSDGDGATNGEELMLGTFPGNAASVPPKAALEKYRQDQPKR